MTRRILILGHTLAGLLTAYRLIPYGFDIHLIDTSASSAPSSTPEPPPIIHGFHRKTWGFLEKLAPQWSTPTPIRYVPEFFATSPLPKAYPHLQGLNRFHPLVGMAFSLNISWPNRWHLINSLEKQWEEQPSRGHSLVPVSAEDWLRRARQTQESIQTIWAPLCRFFLGCEPNEAQISDFFRILSMYFHHKNHAQGSFVFPFPFLESLKKMVGQKLRQTGVTFFSPGSLKHIIVEDNRITEVRFSGNTTLQTNGVISSLPTHDLISCLSERVLSRFSFFSRLGSVQECLGTTISLQGPLGVTSPRLILGLDSWDWIFLNSFDSSTPSNTTISFSKVTKHPEEKEEEETLIQSAWLSTQKILGHSQVSALEEPEIITNSEAFHLHPFLLPSQQFRPPPQTPLSNLFLSGPCLDSEIPTSLEQLLWGAEWCAHSVAESFYARVD